ncbi:MAG: hypothetical protein AAFY72_16955 [Cyanobacteria bacterium J06649_4]
MKKPGSTTNFERWIAHDKHSWPYFLLKQYDAELMLMWGTHISGSSYVYSQLKENSAQWTDSPSKHFDTRIKAASLIDTLKNWSHFYNAFNNWVHLTVVMSLASNLETYIAAVINLALQSDPGVAIGASKSIDGAYVLKHGRPRALDVGLAVTGATKGEWGSRLASFERTFGSCPRAIKSRVSELEKMRKLRNDFGHAFGRDIEMSRKTGELAKLDITNVSRSSAEKMRKATIAVAKELDQFLLENHIGDFEALNFYHELYPELHKHVPQGQRAQIFKKAIGRHGANPRGKKYCKQLVEYWESL